MELIARTIKPHVTRLQQQFNRKLIPASRQGLSVYQFDYQNLARVDAATTATVNQVDFQNGIRNADEIRAAKGLNPLPNGLGQKYFRLSTLIEVSNAGNGPVGPLADSIEDATDMEGAKVGGENGN
jgi:hypothetical protein